MATISPGTYTRQEILSQPEVWQKTLNRLQELDPGAYPKLSDYDQVIFTGCGSTYYQSRWAARMSEMAQGGICRAVPASDLLLFPDAWLHKNRKTLLVAISRSAETTETILALERFQASGYGDAMVVTCYPDKHLAQLTPYVIAVPDAHEESVAQTRSFSNMLLAVNWLVTRAVPDGLPGMLSRVGNQIIEKYLGVAQRLGHDESITKLFFLGSGPLYGLACEAMLKMKEMSLTYSEAFHFLEFRHGPMSMVDQHSLVVGLISDATSRQEYALLREMKSMGARTLGLLEKDEPGLCDFLDDRVCFQSNGAEIWCAPFYLPILQLIAYERALVKGLNPDHPANITSVVVLNDPFK